MTGLRAYVGSPYRQYSRPNLGQCVTRIKHLSTSHNDHMRVRRETKILKDKAIASLKRATLTFNGHSDEARACHVLRDLQHAFEMLLKAGLVQGRVSVFDPRVGRALSFEKCINLSREHLKLTDEEAGTLRAIDALRDDEQHWFTAISEGLLYVHARAAVTLFDDLLARVFADKLVNHLPHRVLPISTEPPKDIQLLIDEAYSQIAQLLQAGRRRGPEARAHIRSLLALEGHVRDDATVSQKDVDRVERAIRSRKDRNSVFPRLSELQSEIAGDGITVRVRFVKGNAPPVRFSAADDPTQAAAVREMDLQKKYYLSTTELAERLGLTAPRALALRRALQMDDDPACRHIFKFGQTSHPCYSDNALTRMRTALAEVDMEQIWREHGARGRGRTVRNSDRNRESGSLSS